MRSQRNAPVARSSYTALMLTVCLTGCPAPTPQPDAKADAKTDAKPDAKTDAKADAKTDAKPDAKTDAKPDAKTDAKARDCQRYCFDTVACGDTCLPAGSTCDKSEGSACPSDLRPPTKFRMGDRAMAGIIAADVPAYNKAQGDPIDGLFDLAMAFEGDAALADAGNGKLHATIQTSMGDLECELFEQQAPYTVANFVGLARGTRPSRDPKTGTWSKVPFYDGVIFHRVIENFMLQTGDRTGTGRGNPGYLVPDEFDPSLRHNRPGILSMANRNRVDPRTQKLRPDPKTGLNLGNTGSSQFFVTVAPTAYLDDRHSIFGRCDTKVARAISKVETQTNRALGMDHKPKTDVTIKSIKFSRKK